METRALLPNRVTDARWGYLDKFDTNPNMGRAFVASMILAVLAIGTARMAIPGTVRLRPVPAGITVPGNVMPVPQFEAAPRPQRASRPRVRPVGPRPVPAPVPKDDWDPAAEPGAGESLVPESATEGGGADGTAIGTGGTETPLWPDPETFVPVEQEPVLVSIPSPAYPELAREAGIDGIVLVRVLVGADGFVHNALVLEGVRGLDDAALGAARAAVFRPAMQQERPVAVWIVVPIEFRLHG